MVVTASVVRRQHIKLPTAIKGPKQVKVGFPSGKSDKEIIRKAIWNHFGTRGGASGGGWGGPIPARPFMMNAMRDNRLLYRKSMVTAAKQLLRSQTTLAATMKKLGILAQGHIQGEITSLASPPNSPATIALKGSSNPLIASGQMRGAVTWQVDNA